MVPDHRPDGCPPLLGKGDVHPPEVHFSDYSLGGFLQQGGWGTVHAATRRRDGKRVAMKFFGYTEREPSLNDIWNEIDLMLKLAGLSGVVQLEGVFSDSESGLVPNKNPRFLRSYPVIVMELVEGGELYSRIANRSSVTERYLATMFRSTAEGLQGIHSRGFVHRDLKLDNILLLSNEEHTLAKIIDFGLMIRLGEDQDRVELKASSLCGTPGYFAPESIIHHEYSYKTDIWQLGCILYSMLCGHPAFHPDPRYQRQITHLTYYPMTGESWRSISAEAKDLVAKILNKCPNSRISLRDILSHPWCGGAAPAAELGPEYLHRVKALALRQKLKRFFIDNDIENEHRIRRQRLEKIEDINITSTSHPNHHYDRDGDDGSNSDAAACLGSPTRDKLKLLKRALVQVISMQASVAYSDSGLISVRDVSLSNLKLSKGELDVTDFCEIMLSLELKHLASPEVFRIFDINQDGKIDIKEFLLTLLSYRASTVGGDTAAGTTADALGDEDAATLYFRFFDLDEDGSISRAELRAVIACLFHDGSPFHALVDDSFSAVALDVTAGSAARKGGSGDLVSSINVENLFDLIDNNPKDGRIDIDEFKVFYHTILLPSATVRSVQHLGSSRSISGAPLQAAAVSVAPEMAATATAEGLPPCGDGGNV